MNVKTNVQTDAVRDMCWLNETAVVTWDQMDLNRLRLHERGPGFLSVMSLKFVCFLEISNNEDQSDSFFTFHAS